MHTSSGNVKFIPYSDANDVLDKLFKSLCSRYQENLEISMRGSNLIFDLVQVMYYKCQKINCSLGGSYIESPDWIKKKKSNKKSEYR